MAHIAPLDALAVFSILLAMACSNSNEGMSGPTMPPPGVVCEGDACPVDLTGIDLMTPPISFSGDLINQDGGLIRLSCSLSVCHGRPDASQVGLYLGPGLIDPNAVIDAAVTAQVHQNLLAASVTAPELKIVEPGMPERSFMMMKLDGCGLAPMSGLACTSQLGNVCGNPCGGPMPPGGTLTAEQRLVFRRWIAQGALNN